jgi:DNA mismatch endonuclease, patch repair protein
LVLKSIHDSSKKLAIFVDGCFWHSCPLHSHIPKSNEGYWLPKLQRNIERDIAKNQSLEAKGWAVLHFWEHELSDVDNVVDKIKIALSKTAH